MNKPILFKGWVTRSVIPVWTGSITHAMQIA